MSDAVPLQLVIDGIKLPEPEISLAFDDFWLLMVKKARKYETRLEWNRLEEDERLQAMIGAATWRPIWLRMEWQFIVDPCRWVKYRRWTDELPPDIVPTNYACHAPAPVRADERGVMPEAVRIAIAALRGKV